MTNYVNEISRLWRNVQLLWRQEDVGPPGLSIDPLLGEVLEVVGELRDLWWAENNNTAVGLQSNERVIKAADEALTEAGEGDRTVTIWRAFETLMRRDVDPAVVDGEVFADDLVKSVQHLAQATVKAWSWAAEKPAGSRHFVDATALLQRTVRMAELEDLRRVADRVRAKEAELDVVVEEAHANLEVQREAVGETGSLGLSTHFANLADTQSRRADIFLGLAIAIVIAFIAIVAVFLPHDDVSVAELISRAVIALPGFGLAAYLAREGGRHRHVAHWATALEVQLKTIDAFGAPMTTADVSEVRKAFAARAFGAMPALPGRHSGDDSPAPVDLQAIIERLVTELRAKG